MSVSLARVIYLSSATNPFSTQALRDLLEHCRTRNKRNDITGLLLYREGGFMQVIEGPEVAVDKLYTQIQVDCRHSNVIRVIKEDIQQRYFSSWSMGFKDVAQESVEQQEGFDALMNQPQANLATRDFPRSVDAFVQTFAAS